jgi:hypothetical protein
VSAEVLRRAATGIRDEWAGADPGVKPTAFYLAVADWLEHAAKAAERDAVDGYQMGPRYPGLLLARTYLGEES